LIIAAILGYPKIFKQDTLEKLRSSGGRISVAVMPFQNMTNDSTKNFWQEMIQNSLITLLSNSEELKVRQIESISTLLQNNDLANYVSITSKLARSISQKLDANVFVLGSINQIDTIIRLNAKLVDSKTKTVVKSFRIDGTVKNILRITDSLSVMVERFLVISKMEKGISPDLQPYKYTNSPEAYKYFILAGKAINRNDSPTALKYYSQAVAEDSNFFVATLFASIQNTMLGMYEDAKEWCLKAYKKRDQMPLMEKIMTDWVYAILFETPYEEIENLKLFDDPDEQVPVCYWQIGNAYSKLFQYDRAIPEFEKTLKIYDKWKIKPMFVLNYTTLGLAYHKTSQYEKERRLYKKAKKDFPNDPDLIYRQAILALSEEKTKDANDYIEKYKSILKENPVSEEGSTTGVTGIYTDAGILDTAEGYYRQALSLEPENPMRMNNLAYFLIDKDRNINKGLELADAALKSRPDNYDYLHTKGWGLYKQGKYQEANDILQKSWDIRREKAIYNHEAFLHLEAAKKAVASQKRTDR
jgi:tetratricopeptide (TPR) repeat protein